jgi:hypothetical protein
MGCGANNPTGRLMHQSVCCRHWFARTATKIFAAFLICLFAIAPAASALADGNVLVLPQASSAASGNETSRESSAADSSAHRADSGDLQAYSAYGRSDSTSAESPPPQVGTIGDYMNQGQAQQRTYAAATRHDQYGNASSVVETVAIGAIVAGVIWGLSSHHHHR